MADQNRDGATAPLAEHVEACIEIAVRLDTGKSHWSDTTTLLAHLHVIQEDYCDAAE